MSEHYARQAVCREIIKAVVDYQASGRTNMAQASGRAADAILAALSRADPSMEDLEIMLRDPTFVHLNMLRGGIAKPTPANIWHLYGNDALLAAMPPSARAALSAMQR